MESNKAHNKVQVEIYENYLFIIFSLSNRTTKGKWSLIAMNSSFILSDKRELKGVTICPMLLPLPSMLSADIDQAKSDILVIWIDDIDTKAFRFLLIFFSLLIPYTIFGQEQVDSLDNDEPLFQQIPLVKEPKPLDSNYVESLPDLWSFRLYGIIKSQSNAIRSTETNQLVKYFPNNLFSLGVGISYKFFLLDIGFNIKTSTNYTSERFDIQGSIFGAKYVIDFALQRYIGYDLVDPQPGEFAFREDLGVWDFGISYIYAFTKDRLSIKSAMNGSEIQKKSGGAFAVGGFFSTYHLKADSSIIPPQRSSGFNTYAEIEQIDLVNFGIGAGYAANIVLPGNFFLFAAAMPGIGWNIGDVRAEQAYKTPNGPLVKTHFRISLNRATHKSYQILSYTGDFYFSNLGHENVLRYNIGKLKFVYGFRLANKKSPLRKVF